MRLNKNAPGNLGAGNYNYMLRVSYLIEIIIINKCRLMKILLGIFCICILPLDKSYLRTGHLAY